jgi:hypothetical protein
MRDRPFASYRYSAFISYATDDDAAWNSFVSCFTDELNLALGSRLHIKRPQAHLSGDNPLVAGRLSETLRANVDDSFAMFLFVHDSYLASEWCLHELEYFKSLFGDEGFRERLYLIAMSETAMKSLMKLDHWKRLCPFDDLVWQEFFRDDNRDRPIDIYASNARNKRAVVAEAFWHRFVDVREHLADRMRREMEKEPRAPSYPSAVAAARAPTSAEDEQLVRVYIEGDPDQEKYWVSLGHEIEAGWEQVAADLKVEPRLLLRPTGLPMSEIDKRPMLDDADGVVLLWGKKTPDSLAAQIKKVEPKLSGPNYAPGLIAYLMDGSNDQPGASSVGNWNVVRFAPAAGGGARVLPDDAPVLVAFLSSVIERKRRRLASRT